MRCSALAEEFIRRGHAVEISVNLDGVPLAQSRAGEVNMTVVPAYFDLDELLQWINHSELDLIVWDSYIRAPEQSNAIREVVPVVAIVDGYLRDQSANVYVDQNIDAHLDHVGGDYEVLAGTDYAILSDRIISVRRSQARILERSRRQILIAMGGTDAFGLAQSLADTCSARLPDVLVNVIVPLAKRKDTSSETEIRENQNVLIPTTNLFELISDADLYLGGCGTSVWESLYIGTPMACVAVADNQELTYGRLVDKELVIGLGVLHSSNFDAERIAEVIADALAESHSLVEMTQRGQAIVDGRGRERIVARAEQLVLGR